MGIVNIVTSDRGWILERLASEIAKRVPFVRYGDAVDPLADLQYYVTYSTWKKRVSPIEVAYFAHLERDEQTANKFFSVAGSVDYCVCHSRMYEDIIRGRGIDTVESISPGVDLEAFTPVVKIGVVGRTYHTGRKGEALVQQVMDVPGIEWHFTGDGWPAPGRHVPDGKLGDFYNQMDYIVVPALYEGGPMCVVEALACGVPVISSKVGWVPEFPHIEFKNGDAADLRRVLETVVAERRALRATVEDRTWDRWAEGHERLFRRLFAERGISEQTAVVQAKRAKVGKVALLTHGSERSSLGGPTVRVPGTARHLREMGCQAEALHYPDPGMRDASVVHGFNIWSPQTSSALARRAKSLGKPYVFSPIFLDHSEQALWRETIPGLYSEQRPLEQMDSEIAAARQAFVRDQAAGRVSSEAMPGHHAVVRETIGLADHVILLSECERRALERIGAKPAASSIVRNPVDPERFGNADPSVFADAYGVRDYILCVARIEPRKNQLLMLQALHGLDLPIVLIGAVSNKAYGAAMERFEGSNLHKIGRIEPDSPLIPSALAGARVVVLPSWAEGAPLAALEAGAAGASMVLSNRSSEPEYFGDFARYCDPADPASIREEILAAYDSPFDATRRAELKAHVADNYSWSRYAEATHKVYEQTLASAHVGVAKDASNDAEEARARAIVARSGGTTPTSAGPRHIVLDVTTSANHSGRWTGIARFEMALARAFLNDKSTDVSFVAWHDPTRRFVHIYPTSIETGDVAGNLAISGQRRIRPRLPEHARDLIVGGSAWMQNTRYVEALSDFCSGRRLSLTSVFHDIIPVKFPHWFEEGYAPRFAANLKTLLSASRGIVSVSEHTKADIEDFAFDNGLFLPALKVLREGDDFEVSNSAHCPEPSADILAALDGRDFVLTVGAVHTRKNYGLLYSVWRRLAEEMKGKCPRLVIVGGVAWNGGETYRALSQDPILADKVHVLDKVDDASLDWLYEKCIFTLYPSLYEGWGLPVGESLSRGKICIATNASSVPEIAPRITDLIDPLDFAAWLARIKFYVGSKSAREAREAEIKAEYRPHLWRETAAELGALVADGHRLRSEFAGYLPGTIATIASPPADGIELQGWHGRETWGTWSAQEAAVVRVPLRVAVSGGVRLAVRARALANEDNRENCVVTVNGCEVGTIRFVESELRLYSFDIPAHCIEDRDEALVGFGMSRVSMPLASNTKDTRPVGIGLSELSIVPAAFGFAPELYTPSPVDRHAVVSLGKPVDLRAPDIGSALLRGNPAIDSAWGARREGTYAALRIMLHEPVDEDLDVTLRYRAVASADAPFAADVVADFDRVVGQLHCASDDVAVSTIRIPKSVYRNVQPLVLEIVAPTNRSPEKLGLGHDGGAFGVGLLGFTVSRACAEHASDAAGEVPNAGDAVAYRLGDRIPLGVGATHWAHPLASQMLDTQGWHGAEDDGRWIMGREGSFALRLHEAPEEPIAIGIVFSVPGELIDSRPEGVTVSLSLNGCEIARETCHSGAIESLIAPIPPGLMEGVDRTLRFTIAADADCVPYQLSNALKDDRRLSVFVREIIVSSRESLSALGNSSRLYQLGQVIRFGAEPIESESVSADGFLDDASWHGAEPMGRWSQGAVGRLDLVLLEPAECDLELGLVVGAGAGAGLTQGPRRISLRVNGTPMASVLVVTGRDVPLSGVLRKADLGDETKLRIEIEIDRCFRPSDLSGSYDDRELGVFVRSATLRAASAAAGPMFMNWLRSVNQSG
ncbi:MAG TPA: glycosyltransferase [Hyphomicrobium sp.]|nr:glycosyltransferase [Hyphomicrobium sp.]